MSCGTIFYLYTPFLGTILRGVLDSLRREAASREIRVLVRQPLEKRHGSSPLGHWKPARSPYFALCFEVLAPAAGFTSIEGRAGAVFSWHASHPIAICAHGLDSQRAGPQQLALMAALSWLA